MKKQNSKNEKRLKKETAKKVKGQRTHNKCKWYDWSTEREFHRRVGKRDDSGKRTEIVEVRAVCRCKDAKAFQRLVMGDKVTSCPKWKEGKYSNGEKAKADSLDKDELMASPDEYFGPSEEQPESTS